MNVFYQYVRFLGTVALVALSHLSAQAQRPPSAVVYDSLGRPVRIRHELIVRFNPAVIERAAVSSRTGNDGPLSMFLKPATGRTLQTQLGLNLGAIHARKIFSSLTPNDSVSIGRDGVPVPLEPLWSVLLLTLPNEADDHTIINILQQQFPTVLYAHFNYLASVSVGVGSGATSSRPPFLSPVGATRPLAFPVPARTTLTLSFPSPLPATAEFTILTPAGHVVCSGKRRVFQNGELTPLEIDVAALPAGQYFYRLVTPAKSYWGRFEKQD
jgi:hypothetical protein